MDFLAPLQGGWGVIQSASGIGSKTKRQWDWEQDKAPVELGAIQSASGIGSTTKRRGYGGQNKG